MSGETNNYADVRTMLTVMPEQPEQLPEGALIQKALTRQRISAREAATRASISEGRWRQIVLGYQATGGQRIKVVAPAATLANMARAVGVTPDELGAAGRTDAAEVLREMAGADERDAAVIRVMRAGIPEEKKRSIIALLLAQKEADERRREEQADRLIQFVKDDA